MAEGDHLNSESLFHKSILHLGKGLRFLFPPSTNHFALIFVTDSLLCVRNWVVKGCKGQGFGAHGSHNISATLKIRGGGGEGQEGQRCRLEGFNARRRCFIDHSNLMKRWLSKDYISWDVQGSGESNGPENPKTSRDVYTNLD